MSDYLCPKCNRYSQRRPGRGQCRQCKRDRDRERIAMSRERKDIPTRLEEDSGPWQSMLAAKWASQSIAGGQP